MKAKMSWVLLTNTNVANIEEDEHFGPFLKLSYASELWTREIEEQIDIYGSDFSLSQYGLIFTLSATDHNILLKMNMKPEFIKIYKIENTDFKQAIEIDSEQETEIDSKDIVAVLDSQYFPKEIYGGAEALYYIQFER